MRFDDFSPQQKRAMTWWMPRSPDRQYDAIICDGAVRSGKTLCMGLGFFLWACECFDGQRFALCGRTVGAIRRNLLAEVLPRLGKLGFGLDEHRAEQRLHVRFGGRENDFYLFGAADERAGRGRGRDWRRISRLKMESAPAGVYSIQQSKEETA